MKKKSSPIRIALRILGGIAAVLLCALLVLYVIPLTETEDKTTVDGSADWMAALDDGLPLSAVVLPGTHDSATKYVQLAFFSKCQAKDVGAQLEAGYRYLDIRLGGDIEGGFLLMHGFTNCKTSAAPWAEKLFLKDVLEQCYTFLDAHPTETVVFAVKDEAGDADRLFENAFHAYIETHEVRGSDHWLLTDHIPTVGEARGKLVLMRRYEDAAGLGAESGVPLIWEDQGGHDDVSLHTAASDNGSYTLWVQDRFKYDLGDKWAAFTAGMAAGETGEDAVSLNFLSTNGTAAYGHPYKYAKALNEKLVELPQPELRGWVVVDFASAPLAEHIYNANF